MKCPACHSPIVIEQLTPEEIGSFVPGVASKPSLWRRMFDRPKRWNQGRPDKSLPASEARKMFEQMAPQRPQQPLATGWRRFALSLAATPVLAAVIIAVTMFAVDRFGEGRERDSSKLSYSSPTGSRTYVAARTTSSTQPVEPVKSDGKSLWRKANDALHPGKVYVRPHERTDGTDVDGHYRSKPSKK
ncbi:MAG: hypothetical protein C0478_18790 [Planctomyces sp.]|nr:hypothetical protein [Planctomyces sp.]